MADGVLATPFVSARNGSGAGAADSVRLPETRSQL